MNTTTQHLAVDDGVSSTHVRTPYGRASARVVKRTIDVMCSATGLLVMLPIAVCIALIIKLDSAGPVLFVQERVGHRDRVFRIVKFRTMRDGADREILQDVSLRAEYEANDFKLARSDVRVTRVGRILRKLSVDELPQLLNVLRGEMSLIGIRPLLTRELAIRSSYEQQLYASARPGMTGLWQVEGRSSVVDIDRLALDRRYIEDWSLLADVKIAARTPLAVLRTGETH